MHLTDAVIGPDFQPANVHRAMDKLPATLRRVAVLPLAGDERDLAIESGRTTLEPALLAELARTRKFEFIHVSPAQLEKWTGRARWAADEKMPANFFTKLRAELDCDAVLFCRLTHFHAYPPLVIGWDFKLVDAKTPAVVWAADEIFDTQEPRVVNSARRYQQGLTGQPPALADSRSILLSPRRFAQYSAGALLATLPER